MLLNLNRMLCKLTNYIVEDLNMKFISMTYDEIKKEAAQIKANKLLFIKSTFTL